MFAELSPDINITWSIDDGAKMAPQQRLCEISGPTKAILTGERTALNFIQLLSATATATNRLVSLVKDHSVEIRDTRKTIPGLRLAQKYAVQCGGGVNHRIGLYDGYLLKDNNTAGVIHAIRDITLGKPVLHPVALNTLIHPRI